ncbi:MAG: hypothetical protein RL268_940 [Pseudomonadota bacterium]|jgi:hypothetical protein
MKSLFMLAPVAFGLAAAGAAPAEAAKRSGTCARATPAMLDAKFAQFNAAWATKNPDTVTALFDDDAVLLATVANVPRTDHAGIRDYFVSFLKGSPVGKIDTATIKSGCTGRCKPGPGPSR